MANFQQSLGVHLRRLRKLRAISQKQLAISAGITNKYLCQLENGRVNPSIKVLLAIAEKGLKVSLLAIFGFHAIRREGAAIETTISELSVDTLKQENEELRLALGRSAEMLEDIEGLLQKIGKILAHE